VLRQGGAVPPTQTRGMSFSCTFRTGCADSNDSPSLPFKIVLMQPTPHVPGYELLNRLGGGPMTVVYAARDAVSDESCAVKLVRPDWDDQSTAIKLLQREARAGLAVRHPHLVRITRAEVTRPPYYLVMDHIPGESLRRRLRRDYRLPLNDAVWVVRQMAEALAAVHRGGFIHGDVKPDNVRLTGAGEAVLIDLGFAHRPGENAAFLREGYVLGTANYLAPELCGTLPAEDFASDLFSLGVLFFEVLTGKLPYPTGSVPQTFRRHACDPPADLRRSIGRPPAAIVALVARLLAHDPEERPRASAVVQQLIKIEIEALLGRRAA
jgi:serine/threonine protein kinase